MKLLLCTTQLFIRRGIAEQLKFWCNNVDNHNMAYSLDYRKRTLEYYGEGHTQAEVLEVFKVHPATLRNWRIRESEGTLKASYPKTRKPRKIPPDELRKYVDEHPDHYLKEIGAHFGSSGEAVRKALKKLKITVKKNDCLC